MAHIKVIAIIIAVVVLFLLMDPAVVLVTLTEAYSC